MAHIRLCMYSVNPALQYRLIPQKSHVCRLLPSAGSCHRKERFDMALSAKWALLQNEPYLTGLFPHIEPYVTGLLPPTSYGTGPFQKNKLYGTGLFPQIKPYIIGLFVQIEPYIIGLLSQGSCHKRAILHPSLLWCQTRCWCWKVAQCRLPYNLHRATRALYWGSEPYRALHYTSSECKHSVAKTHRIPQVADHFPQKSH